MPVTSDQPAPYAPASAIIGLIERHRNKGLPDVVDAEVLERASVSPSLISRTLHALSTLDLIDENGRPSQVLERIRLAPEGEYKDRLVDWLNEAYADALQFINPATDDETQIRDAFRSYKPVGQQPRMVTLFIGLFAAAGIVSEKAAPSKVSIPARKPSVTAPRPPAKKAEPEKREAQKGRDVGGLPAPLSGLLEKLPPENEGWTKEQRDRFMVAFGAIIDFCFPLIEGETQPRRSLED